MLNNSRRCFSSSPLGCLWLHIGFHARLFTQAALAIVFSTFFVACSYQKYQSKPIEPSAYVAKFELKDPTGASFTQYLLNHGYPAERLPVQSWGLDELTYCALFFHPSLEVARAQWRAAQSSEKIAGERPLPTLSGNIAHSNDPDPAKKPFALGLSIDLPVETANKRDIRIESAQHLSQVAKLEIAQAAWQLRDGVAQALTEYQLNQAQLPLLTKERAYRQEILNIMQKRMNLGVASSIELSAAKLQLQSAAAKLDAAQNNQPILLTKLAGNVGLPLTKLALMPLDFDNRLVTDEVSSKEWQQIALLNRLDIRIALERYAAAEAKLKLEIAKQYPDLVVSPGAAFEFGDNIWSLGLSGLLGLLNKNKLGIADANALREVEAAQFETLQERVISDAMIGSARVKQAKIDLENQNRHFLERQAYTKKMLNKFNAGEIDRLEITLTQLEELDAKNNVVLAHYQLNQALNQLESLLQQPLAKSQLAPLSQLDFASQTEGRK